MRGYLFALASVLLVTVAQLSMKWGVGQLPNVEKMALLFQSAWLYTTPLVSVVIGLLAYLVSMVCWIVALTYLPLNRAYPLLSLSYGLVYLAAIFLPGLNEPFNLSRLLGVLLIIIGVIVMNRQHRS